MIHNSKSKTYHSNQQRERHWKHTFLVLTGMGKWEERLGRDSAPVDSSADAGASPQRPQRKQHLLNCSPPPAPLSSWRFPIVLYKQCLRKGWSRLFSTKAQWGSITHPPTLFLGGEQTGPEQEILLSANTTDVSHAWHNFLHDVKQTMKVSATNQYHVLKYLQVQACRLQLKSYLGIS